MLLLIPMTWRWSRRRRRCCCLSRWRGVDHEDDDDVLLIQKTWRWSRRRQADGFGGPAEDDDDDCLCSEYKQNVKFVNLKIMSPENKKHLIKLFTPINMNFYSFFSKNKKVKKYDIYIYINIWYIIDIYIYIYKIKFDNSIINISLFKKIPDSNCQRREIWNEHKCYTVICQNV